MRLPRWLSFALIALCAAGCAQKKSVPLQKVADVPLPGAAVRFDYQSFDPSSGRLYIAHMNANQLVVFDVHKRQVVANLDGFPSVHGVWTVPPLGRVYASATGEHKLAVVDMNTLKTLAKVGPIDYPDGIAYAPGPKRVFVSDEHGDADARTRLLRSTRTLSRSLGVIHCRELRIRTALRSIRRRISPSSQEKATPGSRSLTWKI